MSKIELCHWLLLEQAENCRSVFAPIGDNFENYVRVGVAASSPQFVFPLAFAVPKDAAKGAGGCPDLVRVQFCLHRDDKDHYGPAFVGMNPLKVATLVSELTNSIAQWVEAVGSRFVSIRLTESRSNPPLEKGVGGFLELSFRPQHSSNPYGFERTLALTKAGIEMMAFSRGLKCESWIVA